MSFHSHVPDRLILQSLEFYFTLLVETARVHFMLRRQGTVVVELLLSACNYVSPTQLVLNYKIQEIGKTNKQLTPSIKACGDNHHLSRSPFVAGDV